MQTLPHTPLADPVDIKSMAEVLVDVRIAMMHEQQQASPETTGGLGYEAGRVLAHPQEKTRFGVILRDTGHDAVLTHQRASLWTREGEEREADATASTRLYDALREEGAGSRARGVSAASCRWRLVSAA